jgi:hypothetical protein
MKNDQKDNTDNPIEELEKILEGAGADVAKLFGPALTIFAGQSATAKDDKQKRAELERIILGN